MSVRITTAWPNVATLTEIPAVRCSSPAPLANFAEIHTVSSPEPLYDLKHSAERTA